MRARKARILLAAAGACALCGALAGTAGAAVGDLTQKAGTAGCVSETGSEGECADGKALVGARSVAVSPDGASVYAVSKDTDAIAVFDRAPDGTLTQKAGTDGCVSETGSGGECADGRMLDDVIDVAVSPDGTTVYIASLEIDTIAVFDRAPDGTLTQKAGTDGCVSETGSGGECADGKALDDVFDIVVSPDGANVYAVVEDSEAIAVFDRAPDGTLTQKAGTDGCVSETGSGGECADGKALLTLESAAVSPDGASLYVASRNGHAVAVFDRAPDGTLTQKAGTDGCVSETGSGGECADGKALAGARSVAVSPDGASVYVLADTSNAVAVFDRAPDGTLTQKAGTDGCVSETGSGGECADGKALVGARSVAVSPDGASLYVSSWSRDSVAVFDRAPDGTLTQKAGTDGCVSETGSEGECADGKALRGAKEVAVSPDGTSVYATAMQSHALAVFDREPVPPQLPTPTPLPPQLPTPTPLPLTPTPPPDDTDPRLRGLSLSPFRFRAANRGPSIGTARTGRSTVSYRLSERAAVRFTVQRAVTDRRCVRRSRSERRVRRCTRYRTLGGSFVHEGRAGRNAFRFSGRLGRRKLTPGSYRLRAVATDEAGNVSRPPRFRAFLIIGR